MASFILPSRIGVHRNYTAGLAGPFRRRAAKRSRRACGDANIVPRVVWLCTLSASPKDGPRVDRMRLSDQAALMTLGRLVERIVGIFAGIFLVRLLSKEDYGTFLQVSLIGGLCVSIVLLGLPQSLSFFLPGEEKRRRKRFIAQTAVLTAGVALLASLALAIGGKWIAR